jgi:hypothetical protein
MSKPAPPSSVLRAAVPVALFAQLDAVEAKAREDKVGPDELLARRKALSRPVMSRLAGREQGLKTTSA